MAGLPPFGHFVLCALPALRPCDLGTKKSTSRFLIAFFVPEISQFVKNMIDEDEDRLTK